MNNVIRTVFIFFLFISFSGCSELLQTVDLPIKTRDKNSQEEFNVVEKTLTLEEAKSQNSTLYRRVISQTGRGESARIIFENTLFKQQFPKQKTLENYKLGIGDIVSFNILIDNKLDNKNKKQTKSQWPPQSSEKQYTLGIGDELTLTQIVEKVSKQVSSNIQNTNNFEGFIPPENTKNIIEAKGRVGSDGSVLLLEIGRLEALGKTLNELRSEVRNILIRNGASPRFQLEISNFRSQKAFLTINTSSSIITLNDQHTSLREVLSAAGKGIQPGKSTKVRLQRGKNVYDMILREVFGNSAPDITIFNQDHIFIEDRTSSTKLSQSTVGQDGYIVLENVGRVYVLGKHLQQVQKEISSRIDAVPNSQNSFQIEITGFNSQKALINIPNQPGGIIPITDVKIDLISVLTSNGVAIKSDVITRINFYRGGRLFQFTMDEVVRLGNDRIYLENNDIITVEELSYKPNKVFVLGGVSPSIININPSQRETLADILFTSGGVLSSANAKKSDVYLLRGSNPVVAYHLDAQNPTRLIVADAMQLRPNDILYVAEKPIASFNRALVTIAPLRILLRDIQDKNIP